MKQLENEKMQYIMIMKIILINLKMIINLRSKKKASKCNKKKYRIICKNKILNVCLLEIVIFTGKMASNT